MAKAAPLDSKFVMRFEPQIQSALCVREEVARQRGSEFEFIPEQPQKLKEHPILVERRYVSLAGSVYVIASAPHQFGGEIELEPRH